MRVDITAPPFGQFIPDFDLTIHDPGECAGRPCVFHAPSDHHMRDWPMVVRVDKHAIVERTCEHGVGHPDPDSLAYYKSIGQGWLGIHGCDGCCQELDADEG